jgi:hypothetical protein
MRGSVALLAGSGTIYRMDAGARAMLGAEGNADPANITDFLLSPDRVRSPRFGRPFSLPLSHQELYFLARELALSSPVEIQVEPFFSSFSSRVIC